MSLVYAAIAPKIALPQPLLVKVTYTRCASHVGGKKLETLASLGLRRLHQSIIHKNVRPIRGMLHKVKNYIAIEPITVLPKTPAASQ